MRKRKPEIVAPGGSLEKFKIACTYGADAVYVGGTAFGLRKSAQNLNMTQLETAINFANEHQKKIYVVLNGYSHNSDMEKLPAFLEALEKRQPHALIISDLGVLSYASKYTSIPIHTSTQASITNWKAAAFWKKNGAKRVVVARELSITECQNIQEKADIEVETFIHGAMCVSYSGKCTISNYSSGRDSNRGGCIQSCRHAFDIVSETNGEKEETFHIMNAKDLMGLSVLPQIIDAGIHSLKIEGRMKSNLYLANTVSIYRDAIDRLYENNTVPSNYEDQLKTISNRGFSTGSLEERASGKDSISSNWNGYHKGQTFIGTVKWVDEDKFHYIDVKSPFKKGETCTILSKNNTQQTIKFDMLFDINNSPIETAAQNSIVKFQSNASIPELSIISRPIL